MDQPKIPLETFKICVDGKEVRNRDLNNILLKIPFHFSSSCKYIHSYTSEVFNWNFKQLQAHVTTGGYKCEVSKSEMLVNLINQNDFINDEHEINIVGMKYTSLKSVVVTNEYPMEWDELPTDLKEHLRNEMWTIKKVFDGKVRYQIMKSWYNSDWFAAIDISTVMVDLPVECKLEELIMFEENPKIFFI
jgi:hypothetical protein